MGVALAELSVSTSVLTDCTTYISSNADSIDASGCKTRRREGLTDVCDPDLLDSIRAERVGVYDGMYRSRKYPGGPESDEIGPIA